MKLSRVVLVAAGAFISGCNAVFGINDESYQREDGARADTSVDDSRLDGLVQPDAAEDSPPEAADTRECDDGGSRCTGLEPQKCASGHWVSAGSSCPYACKDGVCTGECVSGTTKCVDDTKNQKCTDGSWGPVTTCAASTPYCNDAGTCGECRNGATKCVGSAVETCASGSWGTATACKFACKDPTGCTGVCSPGTTQCAPSPGPLVQQTCDASGSWTSGTAVKGVCGAPCTYKETGCTGTALATPQTCDAYGVWHSGSVAAGVCGASCTPGSTQCVGTTKQTCDSAGRWISVGIAAGTCGAICTPGAPGPCSGVTPQTCNSTGTGYVGGSVTAGVCGAACTPSTVECGIDSDPSYICLPGPSSDCWIGWTTYPNVYLRTCTSAGAWGAKSYCATTCTMSGGGSGYFCRRIGGVVRCLSGGTCPS